MSSTDRLTLKVSVNADPATESASVTADGIKIATVARKSRPACRRALALLYSCAWCLSPPRRERRAQHEQRVGDDRPCDGCLHQGILPSVQCGQRDDKFGQVS